MPSNYNETLDNLENETVEEAIKNSTIEKIFGDLTFLGLMNGFLGHIYSDEEVKAMIVDDKMDKENPKFQEMFQKVQNSFPIKFVDNNTLPTLCEYAGNDTLVGIGQYRFLKDLSVKYENKLDLVYMRYANHDLVSYNTENGIKAMRDIHYLVLKYAETYFTSNE